MKIDKKINRKVIVLLTVLTICFVSLITIIVSKNNTLKKSLTIEKSNGSSMKSGDYSETKITDKITSLLSKKLNINSEDISILYVADIENDKLTMFLYKDKDKSYEGLCQLIKGEASYDILKTSMKEMDKYTPFTVNTMEIKESTNENYTVFSGVINDTNIKSVNINFSNSTMVNVLIGEEKSYFYINKQPNLDVLNIEALDDSLKIFYKWSENEKRI
jgi:hypothetical protein